MLRGQRITANWRSLILLLSSPSMPEEFAVPEVPLPVPDRAYRGPQVEHLRDIPLSTETVVRPAHPWVMLTGVGALLFSVIAGGFMLGPLLPDMAQDLGTSVPD